jgi:triosephosphate isomerase
MTVPFVGGNWKMNGSLDHGRDFLRELDHRNIQLLPVEVVIFPPYTLIQGLSEAASRTGISLGGQNLFWEEKGAFTGEISAGMLQEAGCTWFLAGHSERRHVLGEDDAAVRRKLESGIAAGLRGILCVGELLSDREGGRTEEVVRRQVDSGLSSLDVSPDSLVIAYEPVWAIGTGLNASPDEAQRVHSLIRQWISEIKNTEFADEIRIVYGGSVKPGNAGLIMAGPDVNGALVGGASLHADSLYEIVSRTGG